MSAILKINLKKLEKNYQYLKRLSNNKEIIPVVKSNAYGFGITQISQTLYECGVRQFCVARLDEALILHNLFNNIQTIVFEGFLKNKIDLYHQHKIIPTIISNEQLEDYKKLNNSLEAWLHIDTGMNRTGIRFDENFNISNTNISCLMTHMSTKNLETTQEQKKKFDYATEKFNLKKSFSKTAGIFLGNEFFYDSLRCGHGLYYQYDPNSELEDIFTLSSNIIMIRTVKKGEYVGYDNKFLADRDYVLGIVNIGYNEGLYRNYLQEGYPVIVNGQKTKTIGIISMDLCTIDLTEINCKTGDEVYFINSEIKAFELTSKLDVSLGSLGVRYQSITNKYYL